MKKITRLALLALLALPIASCSKKPSNSSNTNSTPTQSVTNPSSSVAPSVPSEEGEIEDGVTVYREKLIVDSSELTEESEGHHYFELKAEKSITAVYWGRISAKAGEYHSKGNVIALADTFLGRISTGEQRITVEYSDNSSELIDSFIATKVIKTAEDFQNISEDLQGYYILGNDIDLSEISNFEPLGVFYSEADPRNDYFHGILEGNGHTVANGKVYYSSDVSNNSDVYDGNGKFKSGAHVNGDNIGLFQIIGSSGVVRNVKFSNIRVRGRTIVGVVAGNVQGTIENCIIDEDCRAEMSTHYYDNDCNLGGVAGIVAQSGQIKNTISLTNHLSLPDVFTDNGEDYIGKTGNGWDHSATPGNTDHTWKFANVDRPAMDYSSGSAVDKGTKEIDSNGTMSNGVYAFAGKTWGTIDGCYAQAFKVTPYEGTQRDVNFSQTHLGALKPGSGSDNMGSITNSGCLSASELEDISHYESYDNTVWKLVDGSVPSLIRDSFISSYVYHAN